MSLGSLHCSSVLSLFLLLTTIMRAFCVPSDATSFQCTDLKHISKSYTSEAFIVRVNYTFKGGSYYWEKWSRKGDGSERGEAVVFCKLVVLGLIRKVTLREDRKGGKESASPIWVESIQAEAGTRAWLVKAKPGGVEGTRDSCEMRYGRKQECGQIARGLEGQSGTVRTDGTGCHWRVSDRGWTDLSDVAPEWLWLRDWDQS